ncbi:MAG: ATP-binding protein [Parvibaculum sp.]|uniref:hybrid sensor histidine kinase/response regulator n=1 Tax=Parvibaculum sp. TaxID=2024848 RepID=UPI003C771BA7
MSNRRANFHFSRLSRDFAVKFMVIFTLLIAAQLALEYQHVKRLLTEQIAQRASTVAENFTLHSELDKGFSLAAAQHLAEMKVHRLKDLRGIYLVDLQSHIVASAERNHDLSGADILDDPSVHAALARSFDDGTPRGVDLTDRGDLPVWVHVAALPSLGVNALIVIDLAAVRGEIANTLIASAARRVGVMFVLLITIFAMMRGWVLRPLSRLAREIQKSSETGHFEPPVDMPKNEIGALSSLFGDVFNKLEQTFAENERLAQVANETHAGVLIADASGRIIWANAGFTQKTGFARNEIEGRTPEEILDGDEHLIGAINILGQSLRFGLGCNVETFNHTRSGLPYWASIEVRPIRNFDNEIESFIVIETDITHIKNAERALKKSQSQTDERVKELQATQRELAAAKEAAEKANRAKSDFLTTMSHEIRTPMNGVIGLAEVLLQDNLSASQRNHVSIIKGCGESLLTIVNDILDLSKLEAGRLELDANACSPREVTASVIDLMRARAEEKGLAIGFAVAADVPDEILCDETRLRQILLNLVGNAVKFTQTGSVNIDVTVSSLVDERPAHLDFIVRDTGAGIPEGTLPKLFNRFTQATTATARTYGGTGLGLAISRELATLMNGTIEVTSKIGTGTSFNLRIPIERAQQPVATPAPIPVSTPDETPAPDMQHKLNVLLAEDQPVNQKLMSAVMERLGHRLTIANNGVEAVRAMRAERFDLVLMDIQMPELDGILTTKVIRSVDEAWRNTPIVALTAHAMESHRETYLAAGMDGFVSKPFRMEVLVGEMARVLTGAQEQQPAAPQAATSQPARGEAALSDMLDELENLTV